MSVGLNVLSAEDLESPEQLSVLAVDGDPVAAAISRFYHGSTTITDNLQRLSDNASAVIATFSDWQDDPTEERQDDVADAADRLVADIADVDDAVLLPTLKDLHGIFAGPGPQSSDSASEGSLADDLAAIHGALVEIEEAVRKWNNRRGEDNPEGRGWNVPAFAALLERLQPDSDDIKAIARLEDRVSGIAEVTDQEERQKEIAIWSEELVKSQNLISVIDDYLQRALTERRKEAVDLIQAMRWLRWDPSQRLP